ncbi:VTT domain-containing protein [Reichenbachiella agarivorans]|uniref:VTT domain-containing protein n=1 Tax=Reichenbachiella agarivorans TaxID=2979464 RepID=A0ABY6CQY0_9BACT|nr:VTT domain-containing protein [Reichenbachiella agarivorans]UXP32913.1 VTT domain-containing protein [Reichenbachiella agarivorans]
MKTNENKYKFLLANLTKGMLWLVTIIVLFLIGKHYFQNGYQDLMDQMADQPILVFSTFTLSEILFGIFPPELFMIWSLHQGQLDIYIFYITTLTAISYLAGIIGYFIGSKLSQSIIYYKLTHQFIQPLETNVQRFGGFMIVIAAVTPIPFSAICMLTGAAHYPFGRFLTYALSRVLRFGVYAYIIWLVDKI